MTPGPEQTGSTTERMTKSQTHTQSKTRAVAEASTDKRPQRQPRYHVVLWDDDDHTYEYVIRMMQQLFGHPQAKGLQIATEVDKLGRATCLTTTKEHAELKRD